MNEISPLHGCLLLSALLFGLGLAAVVTRRNSVLVLIGVEFMLNAANLNFVAFWRYRPGAELDGQFFVMFSVAIAAAEAAIGLALILAVYRHRRTVRLDRINRMQG
jgi:NADH:ubiquinone oxidoreductase subunit K